MANSRIMLVCKHCGKDFCIGKGYFGSYSTSNDELHKQLNIFYGEHEHGCCSEDTDCSDNARNHFAILEEGEDLDVLAADVVPKSEAERLEHLRAELSKEVADLQDALKCEKETNKHLSEEYISAQKEIARLEKTSLPSYCQAVSEEEAIKIGKEYGRAEVAREIFEEIERLMENNEVYFRQTDEMQEEFAELKKKYTEEKE